MKIGKLTKFNFIFGLLLVCFPLLGVAGEEMIDLEKIVITPMRYSQEIGESASSTTIITQDEIKNLNANTTVDLLRRVPGLIIRDYYGNGVKASVDSRGFGEQGSMNVLVLVDGRRTNEIDLSGVDWTQIPVEYIERVEIIRGGSGSVLYGDNAASGVINIITKKGKGNPKFEAQFDVGSYNMTKESLALSGLNKGISYFISASHNETNGYRKNSYYASEDFGTRLESNINPKTSLRFSGSFHSSRYGMPGALRDSHLQTMSRRDTAYPDDHGKDKDYYFNIGGSHDFDIFGKLDLDFSFRRREPYSHIGSWNPVYKNKIDTFGFTPKHIFSNKIFGLNDKLIAGIDIYRSDYSSDNYNDSVDLQSTTDISKLSIGGYFQNELDLSDSLSFITGYRYESAKYGFDYTDLSGFSSPIDQNLKVIQNAYNLGLVYKYKSGSSMYANINRSFRFPAVDEYMSVYATPPVNTDLKPQSSQNYEFGLNHNINDILLLTVSIYRMDIKNELFYNPLSYANENYDKTRHDGLELSIDYSINKNISIFNNYSWIRSKFKKGAYSGKYVPMVPKHKDTIGLRLKAKGFTINLQGNYVGERYFINDQGNNFSRLNGYFIMDANLSYSFKSFSVIFGINNLLDKKYSEYGAYSTVYAEKGYYPSCERNFFLRIAYSF